MKAISIRQPWAWAILHAGKRVENRDWRTHYRGPVLLHASKAMCFADCMHFLNWLDGAGVQVVSDSIGRDAFGAFCDARFKHPHDLPRGGIVGRAEIVDCVTRSDSPWFNGPFGFVLANVEPLPLAPCAGALGLFNVSNELIAELGIENA